MRRTWIRADSCGMELYQRLSLLLCLIPAFVGVVAVDANSNSKFELNIAVLPSWVHILDPIVASKHLGPIPVNMMTLSLGNTRSDYERIIKTLEILKQHETHVVIGPFDEAIALATEALNIAYLATTRVTSSNLNVTFQILPRLEDFSQAILDLVREYKWEKVSIFFDDEKGISVVEKLLTNHELMIKSWRLDAKTSDKQVRDHLVHMRRVFMQKSIVFCRKSNIAVIMETKLL